MAKGKKADLAIIFGGKPPKGGGESPEMEDEEMGMEDEGPGALDLLQTAIDSGSPEDWKAAIQACVDEGYEE